MVGDGLDAGDAVGAALGEVFGVGLAPVVEGLLWPHENASIAVMASNKTGRMSIRHHSIAERWGRCAAAAEGRALSLDLLDSLRTRALGVIGARLEGSVAPAAFHQRLAADRAWLVKELGPLPGLAVLAHVGAVVAVWVTRAGDKWSVSAVPFDELSLTTKRTLLASEF